MIPKQVEDFSKELSALCAKYQIRGIAATYLPVWYEGWVVVHVCDIVDTGVGGVVLDLCEYLNAWADAQTGSSEDSRETGRGMYTEGPEDN